MKPLPKKLTFLQKWTYGFYIKPLAQFRNFLKSLFRLFIGLSIALFIFGFLIRLLPILINYFVELALNGYSIIS